MSRDTHASAPAWQFLSSSVVVILALIAPYGESCEHVWDVSIILLASPIHLEMAFSLSNTCQRWTMHTALMQFVHRGEVTYNSIK